MFTELLRRAGYKNNKQQFVLLVSLTSMLSFLPLLCEIWDCHSNVYEIFLQTVIYWWWMNSRVSLKHLIQVLVKYNDISQLSHFRLPFLLLQLIVALHLSSSMEPWAIKTQQRGQWVTTIAIMDLPWKEKWQQCAQQMAAGIPFHSADHKQACVYLIIGISSPLLCGCYVVAV